MTETYLVTLEVDADPEKANEVTNIDWTGSGSGKMTGEAEVELKDVLDEAISGATVADSEAGAPIDQAISYAIHQVS